VFVRPFPGVDGGRWQVSTGGGQRPLWARSGRELYFESTSLKRLMRSRSAGSASRLAKPQALFDSHVIEPRPSAARYDWPPTADVIARRSDESASAARQDGSHRVALVDELKARVK